MKDALFCMEGHWEVTGVGDLDDVCSDVTKDDVAKVQDILWQLDSETVNKALFTSHFSKSDYAILFYLLCTVLTSELEDRTTTLQTGGYRSKITSPSPKVHTAVSAIPKTHSVWALMNLKPGLSIKQSQRFLPFRGRDLLGWLDARR